MGRTSEEILAELGMNTDGTAIEGSQQQSGNKNSTGSGTARTSQDILAELGIEAKTPYQDALAGNSSTQAPVTETTPYQAALDSAQQETQPAQTNTQTALEAAKAELDAATRERDSMDVFDDYEYSKAQERVNNAQLAYNEAQLAAYKADESWIDELYNAAGGSEDKGLYGMSQTRDNLQAQHDQLVAQRTAVEEEYLSQLLTGGWESDSRWKKLDTEIKALESQLAGVKGEIDSNYDYKDYRITDIQQQALEETAKDAETVITGTQSQIEELAGMKLEPLMKILEHPEWPDYERLVKSLGETGCAQLSDMLASLGNQYDRYLKAQTVLGNDSDSFPESMKHAFEAGLSGIAGGTMGAAAWLQETAARMKTEFAYDYGAVDYVDEDLIVHYKDLTPEQRAEVDAAGAAASEASYEKAYNLLEQRDALLQQAKQNAGTMQSIAVDLVENGTEMLPDTVLTVISAGTANPVVIAAAQNVALGLMGVRVFGQTNAEMNKQGVSYAKRTAYAGVSAGIEIFTEKMFDGLGGMYGDGMIKLGVGSADDYAEKELFDIFQDQFIAGISNASLRPAAAVGASLFFGFLGEGTEEVVSSLCEPITNLIVMDKAEWCEQYGIDPKNEYWFDYFKAVGNSADEIGYSFLVGGLMGLFGSAGGAVHEGKSYANLNDYLSGKPLSQCISTEMVEQLEARGIKGNAAIDEFGAAFLEEMKAAGTTAADVTNAGDFWNGVSAAASVPGNGRASENTPIKAVAQADGSVSPMQQQAAAAIQGNGRASENTPIKAVAQADGTVSPAAAPEAQAVPGNGRASENTPINAIAQADGAVSPMQQQFAAANPETTAAVEQQLVSSGMAPEQAAQVAQQAAALGTQQSAASAAAVQNNVLPQQNIAQSAATAAPAAENIAQNATQEITRTVDFSQQSISDISTYLKNNLSENGGNVGDYTIISKPRLGGGTEITVTNTQTGEVVNLTGDGVTDEPTIAAAIYNMERGNENARKSVPDGRGRRNNDSGTRKQTAGVVQQGSAVGQRGTAVQRQNEAIERGYEETSTGSLIGDIGSSDYSLRIIPESGYDSELQQVSADIEAKTGSKPIFVVGAIMTKVGSANGFYSPDGQITVRADHPRLSAEQIANHELFHWKVEQDETLLENTVVTVMGSMNAEEWDAILTRYAQQYANAAGKADPKVYALDEICADYYAQITDRYNGIQLDADTAANIREEIDSGTISQQSNGTAEITGPPAEAETEYDERAEAEAAQAAEENASQVVEEEPAPMQQQAESRFALDENEAGITETSPQQRAMLEARGEIVEESKKNTASEETEIAKSEAKANSAEVIKKLKDAPAIVKTGITAESGITSEAGTPIEESSSNKIIAPSDAESKGKQDSADITEVKVDEGKDITLQDSHSGSISPKSGNLKFSLEEAETIEKRSMNYWNKNQLPHISNDMLEAANNSINKMVETMKPYLNVHNNKGGRYLPEEILGKTTFENGSYGKTIENTTICFRTLSYIDFTNDVKEQLGRPLTAEESFLASQMLYDIAKEPQCLYCYVSLDRKAYDEFLLKYTQQRDDAMEKYRWANIDPAERLKPQAKRKGDRSKPKYALGDSVLENIYREYLDGREDSPNQRQRFNLWIEAELAGESIASADLTTEEKRSKIKNEDSVRSRQIKDAEAYAQGASWAKKLEQYRAYNSDLLSMKPAMVQKLNEHYGLRFYSFSEYTPAFIVENMQQIRDASLKGLLGLAYTKKTDFARIFAKTGMNINISTFGRMEGDTVVADTLQGADWNEVQELRNQYPNVGAVFVATNDKMVEWALAQDWIDVVIPFHIVRTGANIAEFYKWVNNTKDQADVDAQGKNKTISPAEFHNDRDTYMQLIKERGLTPRFAKWADNPNYMKLVNETRRSDLESAPLRPIFDLNAAETSFGNFVEEGGYYGDWYEEGTDYNESVNQVVEDIKAGKKANEVEYGRQDFDASVAMKNRAKRAGRQHGQKFSLDEENPYAGMSYAEVENERLRVSRETDKLEAQRKAISEDPMLLDAMMSRIDLMDKFKPLSRKRMAGSLTPAELSEYEQLKQAITDNKAELERIQNELGAEEISNKLDEMRRQKNALQEAADIAWEREGTEKENKAIEKSGLSAEEYFRKKAIKEFHYTSSFDEAGYMLPNGKMLNFSGGVRGTRTEDHRSIGTIYEATSGTKALNRFLSDGNIRVMASSPGIDIASGIEPTAEQYKQIRSMVQSLGRKAGEFYIDFSDESGHRIGNYSYNDGVSAEKVISDIKYFYENGTTREQSDLMAFHSRFSLDEEATDGEMLNREHPEATVGLNFRDTTGEHIARLFDEENPKLYETREYKPGNRGEGKIPEAYLNKLTGIIQTGDGPAKMVGYWQLGSGKLRDYKWLSEHAAELGNDGTDYEAKPGDKKWVYPISNVERVEPRAVQSKGIRARSIEGRMSLDEEYAELAEDPEGNAERLREMVDAAAKKAGYNYRGFHGSNNLTFSEFKEGLIYHASNADVASYYSNGDTDVIPPMNLKGQHDIHKGTFAEMNKYLKEMGGSQYKKISGAEAEAEAVSKAEMWYGRELSNETARAATQEMRSYLDGIDMDGATPEIEAYVEALKGYADALLDMQENGITISQIKTIAKANDAREAAIESVDYGDDNAEKFFAYREGSLYYMQPSNPRFNPENEYFSMISPNEASNLVNSLNDMYRVTKRGTFGYSNKGETVSLQNIRDEVKRVKKIDGRISRSGMYDDYLKIEKPLEIDAKGSHWEHISLQDDFIGTSRYSQYSTDEICKWAKANGYDGVIIKNVFDSALNDYKTTDDIVVFSSNQVKSAELVTKDDDFEIIPLSERFNEKSRDIRFSLDEEYAELDTGKENDDRELRPITEKEKIQKEIIEAFSGFVYTENNLKIGKQENEMLISNIKSGNSIVAVGTEIYQIFSNKYYYIFTMNSSGDALINFKTSNNSRLVNYVRGILNENNGRFKQFGTDTSQETTNTSVGGEQTERSPDNYSSSFVSSGRGRANHDGNDNYQWNEPEPNRRRGDETVSKENSLTDGRYSLDETGKREWNGVQGLDLGGLSPDEYIEKAMARAAADRADRLRTISRDDFKASESLEALGVKISGSAGIYERLEILKQADKMAKNIRRQTDKAERRLKATAGEKAYAKGIASGLYPASSIPAGMNADTVMELSDWYFAEQGTGSDLISRQKRDIAITLDAKISRMMDGVDTKKLPKNIVLNAKTPARNMRHLFGDKNGERIYQEIFAPVAENEAERYRFINRQYDDVREFEDSTGKKRPLNKTERKVVQLIIENEAAGQAVAEMEMSGDETQQRQAELVKSAAEQILKGTYDASVFEGDMKMAELAAQYAKWQQSQQLINSGKADSVKCQNAAKAYEEKFSQFYNTINDFLVAHGYEPIGFIKNYAPHMQEEATKSLLQKTFEAMGMSSDVTNLPTEIAGMTASYKPNKRWNPYFLSRNNGQNAKLDIAEAYESYVDYMSDVLYHTDDIMRVRAFERYLRSTYAADNIRDNIDVAKALRGGKLEHQVNFLQQVGKVAMGTSLAADDAVKMIEDYITEQYAKLDDKTKHGPLAVWLSDYANKLAAKQLSYDRGVENLTGRRVLNFANKMQKQFAMSQVGGKVSSVLNQGAQLPQIYAELGGKYTALAAKDAIFGRMRRNEWGQQSDFLTGKNGIDYIVTDIPGMLTNWLFTPADIMDGMVSTIAVRGAYLKAINEGLSEREAMKKADKFGEEVMGSRMKGTKPLMFESKNPIVKMATVFQIEALNSWEHIVQDLPRDFREIEEQHGRAKAALALSGVIIKALIAAFAINRLDDELYGGTPAPFDILGLTANFIASGNGITTNEFIETMIDDAWEKATGERLFDTDNSALNDGKFSMAAAVEDAGYNISNEIPMWSNISALLGWGDRNLPMAGMNSIGDVVSDLKGVATGESTYKDLLDSLLLMGAEFLPGGSQMKRTYQGLQAFAQGGEYDYKGNLKYAVGDDPLTAARMALFGKYSTPEAQSYYAAKDAKLTAGLTGAQTRIYKVFAGNGYGNLQAQQLTEELVKALGGSTKQVDVEAAIRAMSLPRDLAATIWQSFDKSWSPSKNPFSTSIGQKIYNELNGGN